MDWNNNHYRVQFDRRTILLLLLLLVVFLAALISITRQKHATLARYQEELALIDGRYTVFDSVQVTSTHFYIYNHSKDALIYGRNQNEKKYIGTLSQLMTNFAADKDAPSNFTLTWSDLMHKNEPFFGIGQIWDKDVLEKIMIVTASNTVARIFSNFFTTEKKVDLVDTMNLLAQRYGLTNTSFVNSTGLDQVDVLHGTEILTGNMSSAKDIDRLAYLVYKKKPALYHSSAKKIVTIKDPTGEPITLQNNNVLIDQYKTIVSSNTGTSSLAGGALSVLYVSPYSGDLIGITILGSTPDGIFDDMQMLIRRTEFFQHVINTPELANQDN